MGFTKTTYKSLSCIIIAIFIAFTIVDASENKWVGAYNWGGADSYDMGTAITIDNEGNTYIAGIFDDEIDFGNGFEFASFGSDDIFLAKFDKNGNCLWAVQAGSTQIDEPKGLGLDEDGNVIMTGIFRGTLQFTEDSNDDLVSTGDYDIFIAKYTSMGDFVWAISAGGTNSDIVNAMDLCDENHIYITGIFSGEADFSETVTLTAEGGYDAFIAIYNSSTAELITAISLGGDINSFTDAFDISFGDGSVYVAGYYRGMLIFDEETSIEATGSIEPFVVKYNLNAGELEFDFYLTAEASDNEDIAANYALDYHDGFIYVTGIYAGEVDFGDGNILINEDQDNIYTIKYSDTGNLIWLNEALGTSFALPTSISVSNNNVFVVGNIQGDIDFGDKIISSAGNEDIVLIVYELDGDFYDAFAIGGSDYEFAMASALDNNGYLVFTGSLESDIEIDEEFDLTVNGVSDIFLFIYGPELLAPILVSPNNNQNIIELMPELVWMETTAANYYSLIVSKDENFENDIIVELTDVDVTSYTFEEELELEETYYWRVMAHNSFYDSEWSNTFSFNVVEDLEITISIQLNSGWNMISSYLIPVDEDIEVIFEAIEDNIAIVKSGSEFYIPGQFNSLVNWDIMKGYSVYATSNTELEFTGLVINPEEVTYNLSAGWNLISYVRNSEGNPEVIFDEINTQIAIVKDSFGNIYIPGQFSNLTLVPGRGYLMYIISATEFTYPAND